MFQWYVIHTLSGSEKGIKQMILDQIVKYNMSKYFNDIVVPVIEVPEVKRGKNIKTEKKFIPGYILIKMIMNDNSWRLVKSIPKVTGFLGTKTNPKALSEKEVQNIFNKLELEANIVKFSKLYEVGELVMVTDGPFETFTGIVEEIDYDRSRLRVSISIFGKTTPIELNFVQVKKNN